MPDISMCTNDNCPLRKKCYRYTAIPFETWQSYSVWHYEITGADNNHISCDGFVSNSERCFQ